MKRFLLLAIVFLFWGCNGSEGLQNRIKAAMGTEINGMIKLECIDQYWCPNGDGEKLVIYDIIDTILINKITKTWSRYDSLFAKDSIGTKSMVGSCLQNTSGYYKEVINHDDEFYIYYDTTRCKLIAYLSVW